MHSISFFKNKTVESTVRPWDALFLEMEELVFDFYEIKKYYYFQKEKENTFSLLIIFIVKSLPNRAK